MVLCDLRNVFGGSIYVRSFILADSSQNEHLQVANRGETACSNFFSLQALVIYIIIELPQGP